jgi:hypothetical protein
MNILALPSVIAFTINLTLCLIVLSSKPRNLAHRLFACFVLSFATWNMGELIMISSINPVNAIFGVRVIFVGLIFAPLFFLHFSFVFPFKRESQWTKGWNLFLLYLIPVAILGTFFLAFRFSDTGKGIPKEVQAKVFDPFFTTKEGGTGLGLSIVHRIITQHGGDIALEATEKKGSTFTITLPLDPLSSGKGI